MIVHKMNEDTDKVSKLFEAEYNNMRNSKAVFTNDSSNFIYRLSFPEQDELKCFIEDLIELYNSREPDDGG